MKTFYSFLITLVFFICAIPALADVTYSSSPVPAATIQQGSSNVILYIVKLDVTVSPVTVSRIQFTLTGIHDNDDLGVLNVYYNPSAPTLSGASIQAINNPANFAAPHAYDLFFNLTGSQTVAAGSSGYFIITVSVSNTATNGNTVQINGAANPVTFSYSAAPVIVNSQTNAAGTQTILAGAVTYTTVSSPAASVQQSSTNNILYIVKADVTAAPVTMNRIQFTLSGTHDADDLTTMNVYYNPTSPSLSGASLQVVNSPASFVAPHFYDLSFNFSGSQTIAAGASGYFIITVSVSGTATGGNTVKVDGAANPVSFSYTTAPVITNSQSDLAGAITIVAPTITFTTVSSPAASVQQSSTNNILYIVKADVTAAPVTLNRIQFTLTGTHDADDLTTMNVYYNPSTPSLSGASVMVINSPATFAAPHFYDLSFNFSGSQTIAAGASGYFIITASVSSTATGGNTVKVNGAANPVTFSYTTTSPAVTSNQSDLAGALTIVAPTISFTSISVPAANIAQGSSNNILYIVKADVTGGPVVLNRIRYTLIGTHDADDLTTMNVYYNPTVPSLSGASVMVINSPATFAAPHFYDLSFNFSGSQTITAGASGYFIITASVSSSATAGNTIKINGAANPVTFAYTTGPAVFDNQTDLAGVQTIQAVGVTISTVTIPAATIYRGTADNILYAAKADVTSLPVTVNRIQFTLTGTMDNNDLTVLNIYFNPTAPTVSGATLLSLNNAATFAAPHAYDLTFNFAGSQTVSAGGSGYFIIAANVDAAATVGNTAKINGAANPVTFTYTTAPTVTNNQTDAAGAQAFGSLVPLTLVEFSGKRSGAGIELRWTTASENNTKEFEIEWSADGSEFTKIAILPAANFSTQLRQYNYTDSKASLARNNFYRLKIWDNDGRFTHSSIIDLKGEAQPGEILAFPNPFSNNLQLAVESPANNTTRFILLDASGKQAASKSFFLIKGHNNLQWDLPGLPAGSYFIRSKGGEFKTVKLEKL